MGLMANVFISALVVVISRVTVRDKVPSSSDVCFYSKSLKIMRVYFLLKIMVEINPFVY